MAYRIFDAKIIKIDSSNNRLIVQRKKMNTTMAKCSRTTFKVDSLAIITGKDSSFLKISDLKSGNRINIDFVRMKDIVGAKDNSLLAKGINVID